MIARIPLVATPAQILSVQLGAQNCSIEIRQRSTGFYLDLYLSDVPVVLGVLCQNDVYLVRSEYLGFTGDLYFHDTQGAEPPQYAGLGVRWVLLWNSAAR